MAADSQQEAHVWLHTILEAPKDSTKSVRGFLWVESAQTGKWSRYYCIADPTHFEWFRTKEAVQRPLTPLLSHRVSCWTLIEPLFSSTENVRHEDAACKEHEAHRVHGRRQLHGG